MSERLLDIVAAQLMATSGIDDHFENGSAEHEAKLDPYVKRLFNCSTTLAQDAVLGHRSVFLTHLANTTPDETIIKNAAEAMEKLLEAMGVPIKQIHV
jgi:hypothetical protein